MKEVLDAYAQRDVALARAVWVRDVEVDALEDSVFRDLLTHMMEDPRNISFCAHLLFCSKNIERVGDHATNIAETVVLSRHRRKSSQRAAEGPQPSDVETRRNCRQRMTNVEMTAPHAGAASCAPHLIVEDEADLSLLLGYNFEAEGYIVERDERGDEAEQRLVERRRISSSSIGCCRAFRASKSAGACARARRRRRCR